MPEPKPLPSVQWWLAECDAHGNPKLTDGPHSDAKGVRRALYVINGLGLRRERPMVACRVEMFEVVPDGEGCNESALSDMRESIAWNRRAKEAK